jgi:uncharacterized protein YukE
MTTIAVSYGAMAGGHDGLLATWGRIERLLADLHTVASGTASMTAETVTQYLALKARWDAAAEDRQYVLHGLASLVGEAAHRYRAVDAAMAAQFG